MKKITHFVKPSNITPSTYRSQFIKDHHEKILSCGDGERMYIVRGINA